MTVMHWKVLEPTSIFARFTSDSTNPMAIPAAVTAVILRLSLMQ